MSNIKQMETSLKSLILDNYRVFEKCEYKFGE